jgi:hypothetical protein
MDKSRKYAIIYGLQVAVSSMFKRTAFAGLGIALLFTPLLASADMLSDLQAQVQALLAQIKILQAQADQGPGSTYSSGGTSAAYCDLPTRSLTLDDSDADTKGDVSRLQKFLAQDSSIYPEGIITGYFGPATLRAVQRWQASHGLASSGNPDTTGYGYVGPKTRSAMASGCGSGQISTTQTTPLPTPTTETVYQCPDGTTVFGGDESSCSVTTTTTSNYGAPVVSGIKGPASLAAGQTGTWTVVASVPNQQGAQLSYSVVWGDEASGSSMYAFSQASRSIQTSATFTHSYPYGGTYQPKFTVSNSYGSASAEMTVTVGGTTQTTGTLTIETDPSTPKYTIAAGGSTGVELGTFKFHASGESITLNKIGLILSTDSAYSGDLTKIFLYNSNGSIIGTTVFVGNSNTATVVLSQPITIQKDGDVRVRVGGEIARIGQAQPGRAGDLLKVLVTSASGTGVTSGTTISANQLNSGPDTIAGVRIYRSYPSVAQVPVPSDGLADGRLMRFAVRANPSGDVGLSSFSFTLSPRNATVSNMRLYAYTDSLYSNPISGFQAGGLVFPMPASYTVSSGPTQFILQPLQPIEVPAGATHYFEFRGTVVSSSNNSFVTTTLNGDPIAQQPILTSTPDKTSGAFIWSPNTFTTSRATDSDWTNGYGVAGLPSSGLTQTRTGSGGTASPSITVTAPNGGEQWEIGQLNTITWSPYGYNPDVNPAKDVTVFLERLDGSTVGQIMETGKASLHTYFNIGGYDNWAEPGQYYVRASNRVTGATDRSDAPFTLLPRAVDMKVNSSDGPVTLSDNQPITITLNTNKVTSCTLTGVRGYSGGPVYQDSQVPMSGSVNSYSLYASANGSIGVRCTGSDGGNRYDTVYVNRVESAASIQITSPNGGEQLGRDKQMQIDYKMSGLKSVSIALYKNDQWKTWLIKDVNTYNSESGTWSGIPSVILQGLGEADNAGSIFKIYITGQKADGSGYIDDKSDAPFSFVSLTQPTTEDWVGGCSNPPVVTGPDAKVGEYYTFNPGVTNYGAPYPQLPSGLTKSNGIVMGTPTVAGDVSVKVTTGDSCGALIIKFKVLQTTPAPTVTLSASPSSVASGQSSVVTWSSSNASYCTVTTGSIDDYGPASAPKSGSKTVGPLTSARTAKITCNGAGGSATKSVTVTVSTSNSSGYGEYRGYMNGSLFIQTANISEADALSNCQLNARNNPSTKVRCTWGEKEIFNNGTTSKSANGTACSASSDCLSGKCIASVTSPSSYYCANATKDCSVPGGDGINAYENYADGDDVYRCNAGVGDMGLRAPLNLNIGSSFDRSANLASSITALEAALKSLLQQFNR